MQKNYILKKYNLIKKYNCIITIIFVIILKRNRNLNIINELYEINIH